LASLTLGLDMPDGANIFGAEVARQLSALNVGVGYALTSYDVDIDDYPSAHTVSGRVALDLPVGALANVSVCPAAGVNATFHDGNNLISVPLGVGLGTAFEVDSGISLVPFVVPHFQWSRFSYDGIDETSTDTGFGLNGGLNLVVSNLFFGALIERAFEDGAKTVFGVQGGIVF
jgi:hypothetical protein